MRAILSRHRDHLYIACVWLLLNRSGNQSVKGAAAAGTRQVGAAEADSPYRHADGTARYDVRSEFTTALRGAAMENSPAHFAPVEIIRFAACGRMYEKIGSIVF